MCLPWRISSGNLCLGSSVGFDLPRAANPSVRLRLGAVAGVWGGFARARRLLVVTVPYAQDEAGRTQNRTVTGQWILRENPIPPHPLDVKCLPG